VNTCYDYLFQLGITNADVFVYHREEPSAPTRLSDGPCGIRVEHRLLLPNHGREGAAFYDYVESVHDAPPEAVAFLHGHGPYSWHSNSVDVATRIHGYYTDVARSGVMHREIVSLNRMDLSENLNARWRRMLFPEFKFDKSLHDPTCFAILDEYNVTVPEDSFQSACAMFILPGELIRLYPKELYRRLKYHLVSEGDDQITGRVCFEYLVYRMFQQRLLSPAKMEWYKTIPPRDVQRSSGCVYE
jgi:hypothetical protein